MPLRFYGNAGAIATRNWDSLGMLYREEGEKELTRELTRLPEQRSRKEWIHEETRNPVRCCNEVPHFEVVVLP
jgi:hypothetical protein